MATSSPSAKALSCAMRILSVRDHSESEVRRKLVGYVAKPVTRQPLVINQPVADLDDEIRAPSGVKNEPVFTSEEIDATLAYCRAQGWLDDARFVQRYIEGRSQRGYGAQRIMAELRQKGIERTACITALGKCEIDWCALARQVAEQKYGRELPHVWQEKAKLQRFLLARGFSHEEIQSIYTNFSH